MLEAIAPFGLADAIRAIVRALPYATWPLSFGLVLGAYLVIAGRLFKIISGRLDYALATLLRRLGRAPLELQHMLAPVAIRAPVWLDRAAWAVLLVTTIRWLQDRLGPWPRVIFDLGETILVFLWS